MKTPFNKTFSENRKKVFTQMEAKTIKKKKDTADNDEARRKAEVRRRIFEAELEIELKDELAEEWDKV